MMKWAVQGRVKVVEAVWCEIKQGLLVDIRSPITSAMEFGLSHVFWGHVHRIFADVDCVCCVLIA